MMEAFMKFFSGLARHGPGTDDDTRRALALCDLPVHPVVLDLGAGTGASALVLAEELDGEVVAVDLMEASVATIADRAERRGLTNLDALVGDFLDPEIGSEKVDLIWCEAAIYATGWERALEAWIPRLEPGGYIVVSDCVWVTDDRPDEAMAFWDAENPEMVTLEELVERAEQHGLEVVETFELDRVGWRDYYAPIKQRAQLFGSSDVSDEMAEVVEAMNEEVRMFEEYGHAWNYAFLVLRKP